MLCTLSRATLGHTISLKSKYLQEGRRTTPIIVPVLNLKWPLVDFPSTSSNLRWERVPEQPDLWWGLVPQHPGKLPLPLPDRFQLRARGRRLLRHQRVLNQPEPLQVRLLQHGRRLPVRMPSRLLQSRTGVSRSSAVGEPPVFKSLNLVENWCIFAGVFFVI